MRRALDAAAIDRADIAFCQHQLGDLAWHGGDLADGARPSTRAGLAADPASTAAAARAGPGSPPRRAGPTRRWPATPR